MDEESYETSLLYCFPAQEFTFDFLQTAYIKILAYAEEPHILFLNPVRNGNSMKLFSVSHLERSDVCLAALKFWV